MSDQIIERSAAATGAEPQVKRRRDRVLGVPVSPMTKRRLHNFRANRRGFWSLWIFLTLFGISLFAEFIANDKPLLVSYDGELYFPIFVAYPETDFGGEFATEAEYRDPVRPGPD